MYLHLGQSTVIVHDEIIGIFDLDNTTVSKKTREFLSASEKKGIVKSVSYELPKTFVVCKNKNNEDRVYLTHLSCATLLKRVEGK